MLVLTFAPLATPVAYYQIFIKLVSGGLDHGTASSRLPNTMLCHLGAAIISLNIYKCELLDS